MIFSLCFKNYSFQTPYIIKKNGGFISVGSDFWPIPYDCEIIRKKKKKMIVKHFNSNCGK